MTDTLKKIGVMVFLAFIIACVPGRTYAADEKEQQTDVSGETSETGEVQKEIRKNYWYLKNGKYYWVGKDGTILKKKGLQKIRGTYYWLNKDGSRADGFRKAGEKLYYFSKNGKLYKKTGLRKIDGKQYYFNWNHTVAAGCTRVGKKYYLFSKKGALQTKDTTQDGILYYVADNCVEAYKKGSTYYYPDGKPMSKLDAYDYDTYQTARQIAADITNDRMSKAQKLKTVFIWVMKKSYITKRSFTTKPGWIPLYANDHFHGKGSTCQGDAAAFAYLAKAVGYKDVYVCMDSPNPGGHAWTEIAGKAYDPLFAQNRGFYKHYAIEYGKVFRLRPKVHIKMS